MPSPAPETTTAQPPHPRGAARKGRLLGAAVQVLADHGVAGFTHRLVARQAGVPLAATTYYFESRFDLIGQASAMVLADYGAAFQAAAARMRAQSAAASASASASLADYATRLLVNSAGRDRTRALCWAEIMLDAPRHPESLALARDWFAELAAIWRAIATASGETDPAAAATSAIDTVIGLTLMTLALAVPATAIAPVLAGAADPLRTWGSDAGAEQAPPAPRPTAKAARTCAAIVDAAIAVLIEQGAGAVTYRAIAQRAGLAPAAPYYHFPTIAGLLAAAQTRLFLEAKARYRAVAPASDHAGLDVDGLIDRTATIFLHEAAGHGGAALASLTLWLAAARDATLRPLIWSAFADQQRAWRRVLARLQPDATPREALVAQAVFIGKLVRLLAVGADVDLLASVRREFAADLGALLDRRHWLARSGTPA